MITVFDLRNAIKDLPDTMPVMAFIEGEESDYFDELTSIEEVAVKDINSIRILRLRTYFKVPYNEPESE